jgi:hypothetical protein
MQPIHHSANPSFPLWHFLTQPVFSSTKVILNPFRFWNHYNIQRLERCWDYEFVQLLECCWTKDLEPV